MSIQYLTKDEVDRLLDAPNRNAPTGLRNLVALTLMYRCGLRASEVCGLYVRDLKGSKIHLRPEITKGQKEGWAFLTKDTFSLLEEWKVVRQRELRLRGTAGDPHLLVTLKGKPINRQYLWSIVQRYGGKAGIEKARAHPHVLRHSYATHLLDQGVNIRKVQKLLRHSDLRTTALYTHISDPELEAEIWEWQ